MVECFEKCAALTIQYTHYIISVEMGEGCHQELIWRWMLITRAFNDIEITHLDADIIERDASWKKLMKVEMKTHSKCI